MDLLGGYSSSSSLSSSCEDDRVSNDNNKQSLERKRNDTKKNGTVKAKMADRRYLKAAPTPSILATLSSSSAPSRRSTALTLRTSKTSLPLSQSNSNNGSNSVLLMNNPLKSTLMTPMQGPASLDPHGPKPQSRGVVGDAQANVAFDPYTFTEQRTAFQRTGAALAPDDSGTIVERGTLGHSAERYPPPDTNTDTKRDDAPPSRKRAKRSKDLTAATANLVHGEDDEMQYGVWGPPSQEELDLQNDQLTELAKAGGVESNLPAQILVERAHIAERDRQKHKLANGEDAPETESREQQNFDKLVERKMSHLLPPRMDGEDPVPLDPTTKFHGKEEFDYKGQSWIAPPAGSDAVEFGDVEHHTCYVPKKCVARFTGHNQGVHRIRLFPKTGHLLLSAGLDGKCKVWSVPNKTVMRTYIGHSAAVRDVQFNNDGTKFLSASFDRFLRLWNTESGQVLNTFTNRRMPYVVKFYPHDDNLFVVGCSDNKIVTYDATSGEITQEYNHHLAPVNTITFVEDHGTKMVTSSDDKKVLVWEWDIGVPIKYISDPTMHSMPVVTLHPTGAYFVGQSLDNKIVVHQARDRFALQRKKKFAGHHVAGYACDVAISTDGQFVCSGDGDGKLFFWEWRRHKMLQKYRAHDKGPSIGCVWHPVHPSTVFTCGWDGVIKMWQ